MKSRSSRSLIGVLVILAGCGGSKAPPATLDVPGVLRPATGLAAADFDIWSPSTDTPTAARSDGAYTATVQGSQSAFVFAGPRAGSASATKTGLVGGLYMTPAMGAARIVGPPYRVAEDSSAALDATTTVLSMILLHPMVAHPSASVMRQQTAWLSDKLAAGWTDLADAAKRYDTDLAAGTDIETDASFSAIFLRVLATVEAELPAFAPDEPWLAQSALTAEELVHLSHSPLNTVSSLKVETTTESSATLKPGTATGTGIDYYFEVRALPATDFPGWTNDSAFKTPPVAITRAQAVVATGFISSSSYFSYADIIGNSMKFITKLISSPVEPKSTFDVPAAKKVYEVRYFSGGVGTGLMDSMGAFTSANYPSQARSAFIHNIAGGAVEALSLIPGAEGILGDEVGAQVVQEAIQQLIVELETTLSAKGPSNITASDIYTLTFNILKTAVDKWIEKTTEQMQKKGWKKFIAWAGWGGKKALKMVMSVPGKVAKGGALANRAARLTSPESLMEVWLAAIEDGGGDAVSGTYASTYGTATSPPIVDVTASWTVSCPSIKDERTLTNKQDFLAWSSCPTGKSGTLTLDTTAKFAANSWRQDLGGGRYTLTKPKTLQFIVPVMGQEYGGSLTLLSQEGGTFPVTVSAAGDLGLSADFTFNGPNQKIFLGPAFQMTYDVEYYNTDGSSSGTTESRKFVLQIGAFNFTSR